MRCIQSCSGISADAKSWRLRSSWGPRSTFAQGRPRFSTLPQNSAYDTTIRNLRIGSRTKVILQGFTGRQATLNARQSLGWGTNIVGGVTPGKDGEHLGLPVLPNVQLARKHLQPDATGVFVAAQHASQAIEEALEAEIPLIVAVAEHIPVHEMLRIHSMLQTQAKSRLVGANSPGIISPLGHCRIGFQPLPCFSPGSVGVVAKSGTLSYEAVASLTRAGLGQSLVIGMGGDVLAGTNFVDALRVFEEDPETRGVVLIGEIGGGAEEEAAEWIREYRQRVKNAKPFAALVAGENAVYGKVMGHAGAFSAPGDADARRKAKVLEEVGVQIVDHPSKFGSTMRKLLTSLPSTAKRGTPATPRGFHTYTRSRVCWKRPILISESSSRVGSQRRSISFHSPRSLELLKTSGLKVDPKGSKSDFFVAISIDRSIRSPCVLVGHDAKAKEIQEVTKYPFNYGSRIENGTLCSIAKDVKHVSTHKISPDALSRYLTQLIRLFDHNEAYLIETRASCIDGESIQISDARMFIDDAAFKAGRQSDLAQLRASDEEDPDEVDAEKDGIVYMKLSGDGNVGTLVNGAGLAVNTNDALALRGVMSTNFLDTGGKATSETVKKSFQLLLRDLRVQVIFVNIFGGLTLCDMIADGIILAFRQLEMHTPVVVRLRGTNEEIGQRKVAESELPIHAFDDFDEAVHKITELLR